jgi:hypothetical protein
MNTSEHRRLLARPAAVATLALAALLSAGPARAADLAWTFKKGDVLRYEFAQKNSTKVAGQGQDVETVSTLTIDFSWTVDDVTDDGSAKITQKLDRVRVDVEAGPQTISYDSTAPAPEKTATNDPAEPLRRFYSAATAEPSTLTVNRRGEIIDAQVPAKLADMIRDSQFQALADSGSVLSAEGLKKMFAQFFPKLPDRPVEVGSTWDGSLEVPAGPSTLTLQVRYTLASADEKTAKITAAIESSIKPRPGIPVTLEIKSQKSSADYVLDLAAGRFDRTAVSHSLEIEAKAGDRASTATISLDVNARQLPPSP